MAKHPVPKKKTSKARTKRRYSKFVFETVKKLGNRVNLSKCPNCGATKRNHHACLECGTYKGRQVLNDQKDSDNITKIKA